MELNILFSASLVALLRPTSNHSLLTAPKRVLRLIGVLNGL